MAKYTKKGRLSDVIALITVLAIDEHAFRSEDALKGALRGEPSSADTKKWFGVAKEHPEFFRTNDSGNHYALLIRSYLPQNEAQRRQPLTTEATQKIIDAAITLHDKEILRSQRWIHYLPFITSILALFVSFYASYGSKVDSKKLQQFDERQQRIERQLYRYSK